MNAWPARTVVLLSLAGCAAVSGLPISATTGPNPTLVEPHQALVPDINIAPAKGWAAGQAPVAARARPPAVAVRAAQR